MKKRILILITLFVAMTISVACAQDPWKILEKYECLSVTIYNSEDETHLDDEQNHAIVTHSQINGSKKSSELITIIIGADYTYFAEVLSKESYEYGEYEYIRYHCRNFEKNSGPEDVIIAFIYEKNGNKDVPLGIIYKYVFSSIELLLGGIIRNI